jgi:hypothetical protein
VRDADFRTIFRLSESPENGHRFSWKSGPHCLSGKTSYYPKMQNRQDHFAYCVQLLGGTTAFSRHIKIDERAIRRFVNGERPISDNLLQDTAKALRELAAEASAAAEAISASLSSEPGHP